MDFIITFFRDTIDGWLYYTILIVNTILIFAIIGYLGEKKEEEAIKLGMNTQTSMSNNGTVNLNTFSSSTIPSTSIPTVAPTVATATNPALYNNANTTTPGFQSANSSSRVTNPMNQPFPNQINQMSDDTIPSNNNQNINEVETAEKAPAILIINSDGSSNDVK